MIYEYRVKSYILPSCLLTHALEEEMATHSSILAWKKVPWTVEPGRLQSMGSQSDGHS